MVSAGNFSQLIHQPIYLEMRFYRSNAQSVIIRASQNVKNVTNLAQALRDSAFPNFSGVAVFIYLPFKLITLKIGLTKFD